jgi:hypothetical protein
MKKRFLLCPCRMMTLSCFLFSVFAAYAQDYKIDKKFWQPDGRVESIVYDSARNRMYIGGDFSSLSPSEPYGAVVNLRTADRDSRFANPDNDVTCVVKDGKGGWYIGGEFTKVGDSSRNFIAHIDREGKVSKMFSGLGFDNSVTALLLKDSLLFVGGDFNIYGERKSSHAFIDTTTRRVEYSFPETNGDINRIIPDNNGGWFVCGNFTIIGDSLRNRLAHINAQGIVSGWNPKQSGGVNDILLDGNVLYIGGTFTSVAGQARPGIASVHAVTGNLFSWKPASSGTVTINRMLLKGNYLYVAGSFSSLGGRAKTNLAALDISTGVSNTWAPTVSGTVNAMAYANNTLYIGGNITRLASTARTNLGAVDMTTGVIKSWNPQPNGLISTLQVYGANVIIGGSFSMLGSNAVQGLAFIDTLSGAAGSWSPLVTGGVGSSFLSGNTLYLSGNMSQVDTAETRGFAVIDLLTHSINTWQLGPTRYASLVSLSGDHLFIGLISGYVGPVNRRGLACFNVNTGKITGWDAGVKGIFSVNDFLDFNAGKILVSGNFPEIGGRGARSVARLDIRTGKADAWNVSVSGTGTVNAMKMFNGDLYLAGSFSSVNSLIRDKLAVVDTATSVPTSWTGPTFDKEIHDILLTDSIIAIGGAFTNVGVYSSKGLIILNRRTLREESFYTNSDGIVYCLAMKGDKIYAGGDFKNLRQATTPFIAEIDRITTRATTWATHPDDDVLVMCINDSDMYVGGHFSKIGGHWRRNLAAIDSRSGVLLDWGVHIQPNANGITAMALKDETLYFGGSFDRLDDRSGSPVFRFGLAAINIDTAEVLPWDPHPDLKNGHSGDIYALLYADSTIYVGGGFKDMGGISRKNLAAVHCRTGNVLPWNPRVGFRLSNSSGDVFDMLLWDSLIYIAGGFDSVAGQKRTSLASVNRFTGVLSSWNPSSSYLVNSIITDGQYLYVGGNFSSAGGASRNGFARLDPLTGLADNFVVPIASGATVNALALKDSTLFLGGSFTTIGGVSHKYAAAVNTHTKAVSPWDPKFDAKVNEITVAGRYIMMGGSFVKGGNTNERQLYLAAISKICDNATYETTTTTVCGSLKLNGEVFYKSGQYVQQLENSAGCDSFLTINLTVKDTGALLVNAVRTTCTPFIYNKISYNKDGVYYQRFTKPNGCDSVVTIRVSMPVLDTTIRAEYCDTLVFNGVKYARTGTYQQRLRSYQGCDSLINLVVTQGKTKTGYVFVLTCGPAVFNGITYSVNGTYLQKRKSYQGCDSNIFFSIEIRPLSTDVSIKGDTLRVLPSVAQYQWLDCDNNRQPIPGATNSWFVPKVKGSYAVRVYHSGCDTISACYSIDIKDTTPTSIQAVFAGKGLSIYPNPVQDRLELRLPAYQASVYLQVTDMTGRRTAEGTYSGQTFDLDMRGMAKGVYILSVTIDGLTENYRVVKE